MQLLHNFLDTSDHTDRFTDFSGVSKINQIVGKLGFFLGTK